MSKYTNEELIDMAKEFVEAEKQSDMRCIQLTLAMSMKTGWHPEDVRNWIHGLAGVHVVA